MRWFVEETKAGKKGGHLGHLREGRRKVGLGKYYSLIRESLFSRACLRWKRQGWQEQSGDS